MNKDCVLLMESDGKVSQEARFIPGRIGEIPSPIRIHHPSSHEISGRFHRQGFSGSFSKQ